MSEPTLDDTIRGQIDIVMRLQAFVKDRQEDPAACREYSICLAQAVDKLATLATIKQTRQLD